MSDSDTIYPDDGPSMADMLSQLSKELNALSSWKGSPKDFWSRFSAIAGRITAATSVNLLVRPEGEETRWKRFAEWNVSQESSKAKALFWGQLESAANYCLEEGQFLRPLAKLRENETCEEFILALPLPLKGTRDTFVATILVERASESKASEMLMRATLLAELPNQLLLQQAASRAKDDVRKFASVLDLVAMVSPEEGFLSSAMSLCNGVASTHHCERVSLAWIHGDGVQVKAISRTEKFDRKMEAVQSLEAAMEESLDQDEIVVIPQPENSTVLTRDHEEYARSQELRNVCSVPLRKGDEIVGILTCERMNGAFAEPELQQIKLICDLLTHRLEDLKLKDRWIGTRMKDSVKTTAQSFVGPEHTWAKLLALTLVLALIAMFVVRLPYRVEANFIVQSEEVSFLTAPFDSYIESVQAESGDTVQAGDTLIQLDTDELILQESSIIADLNRYQREAEKARADRSLADMRISEALVEQTQARLDLVRWRIDQSSLKAPFDGVLVEGDLKERLGAPVREGEALFRIARIDKLYLEAEAEESDVEEVLEARDGEAAFVSQPKLKFPVNVVRVEPAAVTKDTENVFVVRAEFVNPPEDWFRPGMSGICKLNSGKRSLFWIMTHRTTDFLRMFFWW